MGENNDTGHAKSNLEYLGKKVINYEHHSHFLEVCLNLQTIPKGLQMIKKTPCIRNTDNIFRKTWKKTLRNTKMALIHQLKEKDKAIYSQLHKDFLAHITKSLDDFLEISDIRVSHILYSFLLRKKINYLIAELQNSLSIRTTQITRFTQSYADYRNIIQ